MKRREFAVLAFLTVVSGLVGGALSNRILAGGPAFAQGEAPAARCIQAESFQLVDAGGNVRAELCVSPEGFPELALIDENFIPRAKFSLTEGGRALMTFRDRDHRLSSFVPAEELALSARWAVDPIAPTGAVDRQGR